MFVLGMPWVVRTDMGGPHATRSTEQGELIDNTEVT